MKNYCTLCVKGNGCPHSIQTLSKYSDLRRPETDENVKICDKCGHKFSDHAIEALDTLKDSAVTDTATDGNGFNYHPKAASDAHKQGSVSDFGTLSNFHFFDPTGDLGVLMPKQITEKDKVLAKKLQDNLLALNMEGYNTPENGPSGMEVRYTTQKYAEKFAQVEKELCLEVPQRRYQLSLNDLGCSSGPASGGSHPDGFFFFNQNDADSKEQKVAFAVWENKGDFVDLHQACRQVYVTGSNIAATLVQRFGTELSIVVPHVMYNGHELQFSATVMLTDGGSLFPCNYTISPRFSLNDMEQCISAAQYLRKIQELGKFYEGYTVKDYRWCKTAQQLPNIRFKLSQEAYHIKLITNMSFSLEDVNMAFLRMLKSLKQAHGALGDQVCLPLAYVHPEHIKIKYGNNTKGPFLVFKNLGFHGFSHGLSLHDDEYKKILDAARKFLTVLHEAGVVHLDFYPSNWMMKKVTGTEEVRIAIIDWDTVWTLGDPLPENLLNMIRESCRCDALTSPRVGIASAEMDTIMIDALEALLEEHSEDVQRMRELLASADPSEMNIGFKEAMEFFKNKKNAASIPNITALEISD